MEWNENDKGNFVAVEDEVVTTVFLDRHGKWRGIREGVVTAKEFTSPYAAMEEISQGTVLFLPVTLAKTDTGWRKSQQGTKYRRSRHGIATVKKARSGKWYVIFNQSMIQDNWFLSEEEAMKFADGLLS